MKFAIISAGEGSRLAEEGLSVPKPLVTLNGVPMIERLIRVFIKNGAESIVIIINNESPLTREFLEKLQIELPLELIIKTTPSSMHSFYELSSYLKETDKFCLTTVDTIFREEEFTAFIDTFRESELDGCMAVTDFIDDEKPLYISIDQDRQITGFYDERNENTHFISGGIYCLRRSALEVLEKCMSKGLARMRNFQRELIADGLQLEAYPFKKIVDVDHVGDIKKAEAFLAGIN